MIAILRYIVALGADERRYVRAQMSVTTGSPHVVVVARKHRITPVGFKVPRDCE